jgi:DNA-binding MarR family transcriptional regulator
VRDVSPRRANLHGANLLGALALLVTDRVEEALAQTVGRSQTAAAALSALDQFLDGPTVERLAQVVGLSQSGAVRLVDRLERDGYVRRGAGADARSITVSLTPAGSRIARRLRERRDEVLIDILQPLDATEQRVLGDLVGRLLVGMMREPGARRWGCRLCDLGACGRAQGQCPIEQEARRRHG